MLEQVQMLIQLPQCEIKGKPVSLQTAQCMVGIEVLVLHTCQFCLQLGQVLSGLSNFTPVPVGVGV